ncbi:hypothetical protein BE04_13050 [Sorangium cellulosum]|uniref:Uncharacterized protein n=2 Tax=Sorangium cellulosum TaxID=56 RepID=A0A150PAV3_SORCE|nr:hypothetical protein [Sorangium cellulosum]AGP42067.1 hypothetical protein SCE1572_50755 [Sorangium cellulosum So0157-2]KYF52823.1 hypothetical protein BE04_13050 [Sorangium cellulosum]
MTKLLDLIAKIDQLDREDVIFAKPEWRPDSEASAFRLAEDYRVPEEVRALGYEYFLEVDTINQMLEESRSRPDASLNEKCERIIHHATYDA